MTLGEMLSGVAVRGPLPDALVSRAVTGLDHDSRQVAPGFVFFALAGHRADGSHFAEQAMSQGALAAISEMPRPAGFAGPWIEVEHGRRALSLAARNFYRRVVEAASIAGITGTNGKTTTSYIADSILRAAGWITALVGTIEYHVAGQARPAVNTTPESLDVYRILEELAACGGAHATMEVSSHALALGRVHGVPFHTAVFTNLTRDHLDFHGTMEHYFAAKNLLFRGDGASPPRRAALNADDDYARRVETAPETEVLWYSIDAPQAPGRGPLLRAVNVRSDFDGLHFDAVLEGKRVPLASPLIGRINVYNILAACAAGLSFGLDWDTIVRGVSACRAVPGRFERVEAGQPFLVAVDYAHTDDALRNAIEVARSLHPRRVITLFGCGGDRDRAKRPLMAAAAASASDFVVLTSDNPRSEDPIAILTDAMVGLGRYDTPHVVEPDRARAIRRALGEAREGDIVLIAGKGHETYQVLRDRTIHFDDREVALEVLRSFGYGREKS
ncbi:MAG: UDP-N-acetylmuramoyl-L-alanyl-D-glutamate--2,6-diaminopimelate ligase [Acidobacteria bacterium]|nr:UDP-N-acetylmuramoyl-L-alanyl-D-glutamate--2,6-diaminopimelate ligase [Acidobacteriota bacterium]